jgi:hypothetical protein
MNTTLTRTGTAALADVLRYFPSTTRRSARPGSPPVPGAALRCC